MRFFKTAIFIVALALTVAPGFAHEYKAGDIRIGHPWSRATPPNAPVAGAYMTLENTGAEADRLVGGSTPSAKRVELHSMTMDDGVMKMRQLSDGLAVPAGETVELAPGGYHIMLIEPARRLSEGDRIPLTLEFEKGGSIDVELAVESMGARHSGHGMNMGGDAGSMGDDMETK